jgi:hypothetical protein
MSTVALDHYKNRYLVNALSEAEEKAQVSAVELGATYGKLRRAKETFNVAHTKRDNLRNELNSSIRLANGCNSTDQKEEKESITDWKILKSDDDKWFAEGVVEGENDEDVDEDVDDFAEFKDEEDVVNELDEANSNAKLCKATEEYLQYIWTAQEKMENGLIKEAQRAELKATKVLDWLESGHIDAKLIFSKGENTFHVSAADMLRPRSLLSDEDVTLALSAAAELDDSEIFDPLCVLRFSFQSGGPSIDWNFLELGTDLATIQRFHFDRKEGVPFKMNIDVWESLQIAMKNRVVKNKEANSAQLKPPHADSALIARYNQDAHFKSETTEAIASSLHDSLSHCKLRSRPWITKHYDVTTRMGKIPFEFPSYEIFGFDIDRDLLAMCGNRNPLELRYPRNFVGFTKVLCPGKLAGSLFGKKGNILSNTTTCLYRGRPSDSEWFASCVADDANGKIWAASSISGTIHGFSLTEVVGEGDDDNDNDDNDEDEDDDCSLGEDTKTKRAAAAVVTESGVFVPKLTFREQEIASAKKFCTTIFNIAKSDQHIFGSAGTNCLSVWSIDKALRGGSLTVPRKE